MKQYNIFGEIDVLDIDEGEFFVKKNLTERETKKIEVMNHLQKKGSITVLEAQNIFKVENLSNIIGKFRKQGLAIETKKKKNKQTKYVLL